MVRHARHLIHVGLDRGEPRCIEVELDAQLVPMCSDVLQITAELLVCFRGETIM